MNNSTMLKTSFNILALYWFPITIPSSFWKYDSYLRNRRTTFIIQLIENVTINTSKQIKDKTIELFLTNKQLFFHVLVHLSFLLPTVLHQQSSIYLHQLISFMYYDFQMSVLRPSTCITYHTHSIDQTSTFLSKGSYLQLFVPLPSRKPFHCRQFLLHMLHH